MRPTHSRSPVVTALRERPRDRVEVELDGAPWRVVPAEAVVRAGLAPGRPLDRASARALGRELRRLQALVNQASARFELEHTAGKLLERWAAL